MFSLEMQCIPWTEGLGHRQGSLKAGGGWTGVTTPAGVVRRGVFPDAVMRPGRKMACVRSAIACASETAKSDRVGFEPTTSSLLIACSNHCANLSLEHCIRKVSHGL